VVAPALHRQQVGLDRLGDELVAELQALVRPFDQEAVVQPLHDPGAEVGVEDAVASAGLRGRSRGQPLDQLLERRADQGKGAAVQGPAGGGEEAQDAAALGRAAGDPGEDQLLERRAEREAGQLAPRGEDLLRDERVAAGPLRDEEERRRRGSLALDLGHQLGEVETVERPEVEVRRRVGRARDLGELRQEGVAA
jgi:hypothetical protein